jgi:predicted nucleic acid-binding protein
MKGESLFLDTNVLVYLFDVDEPVKKAIAESIFREQGQFGSVRRYSKNSM